MSLYYRQRESVASNVDKTGKKNDNRHAAYYKVNILSCFSNLGRIKTTIV